MQILQITSPQTAVDSKMLTRDGGILRYDVSIRIATTRSEFLDQRDGNVGAENMGVDTGTGVG